MIVVAELPSGVSVHKKNGSAVVVQTGDLAPSHVQGVSSSVLVATPQEIVTTEVHRNTVILGAGANVVVTVLPTIVINNGSTSGGTGGAGIPSGSSYPAPSGTLLVLNTLATAGVLTYHLSIILPATSRIILYMNGVIADSMHNGVDITILGYSPGK